MPLLFPFYGQAENGGQDRENFSARNASQSQVSQEPDLGLGVKEIPRPTGGKDRLFYSVTKAEEEEKRKKEEKEKEEKSWEMLKNILIKPGGKSR